MSDPEPDLPAASAADVPARTPAPAPAPEKPRPRRGGIDRVSIGLVVILQAGITLALFLMVNTIGFRHFHRWDLSADHKFSLSELTRRVLDGLQDSDEKVHAIGYFPEARTELLDIGPLLREYQVAGHGRFTVEYVETFRDSTRAQELKSRYKFANEESVVILSYKDQFRVVPLEEMFRYGEPDQKNLRKIEAFAGEEAITRALLGLTEERPKKVYFITGHNELDGDIMQGGYLATALERQNISLGSWLNLSNVSEVPEDATALILFNPEQDLTPGEIARLDRYWSKRKGRIFLFKDGMHPTAQLDLWLSRQGLTLRGDRVVRTKTVLMPVNGKQDKRDLPLYEVVATPLGSGTAISRFTPGTNVFLTGRTQSMALNAEQARRAETKLTPLLLADPTYWGETSADLNELPVHDNNDFSPPLIIAAALERGAIGDIRVDTSRMIVFGNGIALTNAGLPRSPQAMNFVLNCANWMLNREKIAGVPPRSKAPQTLSIDDDAMGRLLLTALVLVPAVFAVLGIGVAWSRRYA